MAAVGRIIRLFDDAGAVLAGATVAQAAGGLVDAASGGTIGITITVTERSDGFYYFSYDADVNGEALFIMNVSKVGSTVTGANAKVGVYLTKDSGRIITNVDAPISSKMSTFTLPTNFAAMSLDSLGRMTLTPGEQATIVTNLMGAVVFGSVTVKQVLGTTFALLSNDVTRAWNPSTHTATIVAYAVTSGNAADHTKPMVTETTIYDSSDSQVVSRTVTFANLP